MWAVLVELWKTGIPRMITWIAGLWDSNDPTTEVKLVVYGLGAGAASVWLTTALIANRGKVYPEWNTAFITFCALIGVGASVEAIKTLKGSK